MVCVFFFWLSISIVMFGWLCCVCLRIGIL